MSTVGATLSPYFFHSGQPWRRGDLLHSLSHLMYRELQPCSRQRVAARCASRAGCPNLVQVGLRKSEDKVTQWRPIADLASWPRVVSCAAGRAVDFERWHNLDSATGGECQLTSARASTRRRLSSLPLAVKWPPCRQLCRNRAVPRDRESEGWGEMPNE